MLRLLILLLLLPTPLLAFNDAGSEAIDYPSQWGTITFAHWKHQSRSPDCLSCHHQGVEMGACGNCHGVIPGLPQRKDVLHKKCVACHWQKRGPTECSGCHDPERLDESVYDD